MIQEDRTRLRLPERILHEARADFEEAGVAHLPPRSGFISQEAVEALNELSKQLPFERQQTSADLSYVSRYSFSPVVWVDKESRKIGSIGEGAELALGAFFRGITKERLGAVLGFGGELKAAVAVFNRYGVSDCMVRHPDNQPGFPVLGAVVVGLQDGFSGGELAVYPPGGREQRSYRMSRGAVTLIRIGVLHEVLPVTGGERETFTVLLGKGH